MSSKFLKHSRSLFVIFQMKDRLSKVG